MSEQSQKLVPKLRFPEFLSGEAWDFLNANKIFEPISNKNHNSDLPILAITQEHGAIPREMIDYNVIATEQSIQSYKVVEVGEFIISLRSFQGGIEYSNYRGICSPAYIILRKKVNVFDLFFKYYFKTDLFIRDLNKNIEGIRDGKMVSFSQFSERFLPLPKYEEQQKIAECLLSLDDLIIAQNQKVECLKQHKKGLMQQLFPPESENVPERRFPEFDSTGKWEEFLMNDITFKVSKRNKGNEKHPVYSINNVKGFVPQSEQFEGVDSSKRGYDISMYNHIDENTFAYNPARINVGSIGYSGPLKDVIISSLYVCFKTTDSVNDDFLTCYLETDLFKKAVDDSVEGGIRSYLFYENFAKIRIKLPTIPEQKKIAEMFTSINEFISHAIEIGESLKKHKKGLMQCLFPKLDEAS